jgi:hypothetical protein
MYYHLRKIFTFDLKCIQVQFPFRSIEHQQKIKARPLILQNLREVPTFWKQGKVHEIERYKTYKGRKVTKQMNKEKKGWKWLKKIECKKERYFQGEMLSWRSWVWPPEVELLLGIWFLSVTICVVGTRFKTERDNK